MAKAAARKPAKARASAPPKLEKARAAKRVPAGKASSPPLPEICDADAPQISTLPQGEGGKKIEDIDWETIRADYEIGSRPLAEIALEHKITTQKITRRARDENWPKRGEVAEEKRLETDLPQDAEALAARLTKLIAREIADIERQRKTERDEAEGERQARRLATLVRSIDKLHEIEKAARLAKRNDPEADKAKRRAEDELIRAELESRLARLLDGGGKGRLREGADAARAAAARP